MEIFAMNLFMAWLISSVVGFFLWSRTVEKAVFYCVSLAMAYLCAYGLLYYSVVTEKITVITN